MAEEGRRRKSVTFPIGWSSALMKVSVLKVPLSAQNTYFPCRTQCFLLLFCTSYSDVQAIGRNHNMQKGSRHSTHPGHWVQTLTAGKVSILPLLLAGRLGVQVTLCCQGHFNFLVRVIWNNTEVVPKIINTIHHSNPIFKYTFYTEVSNGVF